MELALDQDDSTTRAQVQLDHAGGTRFVGIGLVQGGPRGMHLPDIAAELAVARAFSDLTEELLEAVATDIESSLNHTLATTPAAAS